MPNRVIESMTSVVTATGWTVRVWWTVATFEDCFGSHSLVTSAVRDNATNPETIRAALEALPDAGANLAAFEIKDVNGNGGVVYPNWI